MPDYQKPVFDLHKHVTSPVKIASIELLQSGSQYFVRTRSTDGVEAVILTKDMEDFIPILHRRVIPHFLGKDARDIETLVDDVYIANYKLSGQAFWCPVAYVEQSIFDLLGRTVRKPSGELMGGILRKEIPVYLSGSGRDTTAEEEVDVYVKGVAATGAKAVKFKIGGRMSANRDAYPGRTDKILELAAKQLAGKVTLMADANGSYTAARGHRGRQEAAGHELPLLRRALPLGRAERNEKSGRRAHHEDRLRRAEFQPLAIPVADRKQGHRRRAARPQLQRRLHPRRPRGAHGAQGQQHVDLPAQHPDRRRVRQHPDLRRHHAEHRTLHGVCVARPREKGILVHAQFRNPKRRDSRSPPAPAWASPSTPIS